MIAVTTGEIASGTNIATRRKLCPRTRVWIRSAAPSPKRLRKTTVPITNASVFRRDDRNTGSDMSAVKLWTPAHLIESTENPSQ